jgi:hypothetical protein
MSEQSRPRFVAEDEHFTFPLDDTEMRVHGPCYVSPDETYIYFPDGDTHMSVSQWQKAFCFTRLRTDDVQERLSRREEGRD